MITELIGATYDLAYLVLFWIPGFLLMRRLGEPRILSGLCSGFLISSSGVVITFALFSTVGAGLYWWSGTKMIFIAATAGLLVPLWRRKKGFGVSSVLVLVGISAVAVVLRNLLRLDGPMQGPDQFLVGWISSLAQAGHDPAFFGSSEYLKRGFAFPLLLAQGRDGELLLSITIVVTVLAALASINLALSLSPTFSIGFILGVVGVGALWVSTPIIFGMAFYTNGHGLMALAFSVYIHALTALLRGEEATRPILFATLTSSFVMATTRPEGVALPLILGLVLFALSNRGLSTRHAVTVYSAAPLGFLIWFLTTNMLGLGPLVAIALGLGLGLVIATVAYLSRRGRSIIDVLFALSTGGVISLGIVQLVGPLPFSYPRLSTFIANTFLGEGFWGYTWWLFLIGLLIWAITTKSSSDRFVTWAAVVGLFFTIGVKLVDGWSYGIAIPGFSSGWGDSINRTLFHVTGLFSAVLITLLARGLPQKINFRGRGSNKTDRGRPTHRGPLPTMRKSRR